MFVNLGNDLVFDLNLVSSVTKGGSADVHTIVVRLQQSVSDTALVLVARYDDLSRRDADFQALLCLLNAKSPSELMAQGEKESVSADDSSELVAQGEKESVSADDPQSDELDDISEFLSRSLVNSIFMLE